MNIIQINPDHKQQVRQWLDLPFRLYRDTPQWAPPLSSDASLVFDRRRHPFYEHSDAAFFLAQDGSGVVGRIAALDNRNFNQCHQQNTAFFGLFECEENVAASRGLLEAALAWAGSRGRDEIVGPKGFTALDGQGVLVKGFEHRPALSTPYNPAYYEALVLEAGFEPLDDVFSGYMRQHTPVPERVQQMAERAKQRYGLRVTTFKTPKEVRAFLPKFLAMYNRSLGRNADLMPITDREFGIMADQILAIADPRLLTVILKEEEPVGFGFAYPDVTAAIQRTKGHLFPLGWIDLLLETKRTQWLNINGIGIVPEYQGLGVVALLFSAMSACVRESRYPHTEAVQINGHNPKMILTMREWGIDYYKVHRVYRRAC